MSKRSILGALAAAVFAIGCGSGQTNNGFDQARSAEGSKQQPMLNLSHIECNTDGTVNVHFVLLFAGNATIGNVTGHNNGEEFTAYKGANTGNVWHFNATVDSGVVDITDAQVQVDDATISLHNPDAYADTYTCGANACTLPTDSDGYKATQWNTDYTAGLLCTDNPYRKRDQRVRLLRPGPDREGRLHHVDHDV